MRTSKNSPSLRTWVNKRKKEGRALDAPAPKRWLPNPLTPLNARVRMAASFVVAGQHLAQLLRRLLRQLLLALLRYQAGCGDQRCQLVGMQRQAQHSRTNPLELHNKRLR
jgi:hypothetical protein